MKKTKVPNNKNPGKAPKPSSKDTGKPKAKEIPFIEESKRKPSLAIQAEDSDFERPFKSTKASVDQRVNEVLDLLLNGFTRSYIIQYGSKWKISDRQIDDYISQASKILKELNQLSLQDNLSIITSNQWKLYRSAINSDNLTLARQILMDLAKLRGLDQQTINHVIEDRRELESLSDDELTALLESNPNEFNQ